MKYYCIKRHDMTDCGAACLAKIISNSKKAIIWLLQRINFID